jgi:hypothetical protein
MILEWERDKGILLAGGLAFDCRSEVRNEVNGRRALHVPAEVRRGVLSGRQTGPAYMPRPFPKGQCHILSVEMVSDPDSDFYPVKIVTDATQRLEEWLLDEAGGYDRPSGRYFVDTGYHLHFDMRSMTTLGCGRVGTASAAKVIHLASILWDPVMVRREIVLLSVV